MFVEAEKSAGLVGGRLCLDFANTVHNYGSDPVRDDLANYSDLVSWSRLAGILNPVEGRLLSRAGLRRPAEAVVALQTAKDLRQAIFQIFSAIAGAKTPAQEDLAVVNAALSEALGHSRLVPKAERFVWSWDGEATPLHQMLWPIAKSTADLLTSDKLSRVRQCQGENCTWLFLDTSKNHTRRWCEMKVCGNRVKARRHYERKRSRQVLEG
jgi:predicted RNA-binding Zn ribbon-like protein